MTRGKPFKKGNIPWNKNKIGLQKQKTGSENPNYAGDRIVGQGGYIWIWHKGKRRQEHRVVIEEHIGRRLKSSELVHHKNEIRSDNELKNLEIMSRSSHRAHHNKKNKYGIGHSNINSINRKRDELGKFI